MDLAIRVNVRYAAPPNSQIKDALRLFKSPRWVQSIIRYIMPQLNSVSPASLAFVDKIKKELVEPAKSECESGASCVVCMEAMEKKCIQLPCQHQFHEHCIEPWLKMHSTCPTCRDQLPTDACTNYSVYAINTTIILQQSQASMPTAELLELPASNQVIRAIVNARVRRNVPSDTDSNVTVQPQGIVASEPSHIELPTLQSDAPVMNASVLQRGGDFSTSVMPCATEPIVPMIPRVSSRRRFRDVDGPQVNVSKRARLEDTTAAQQARASV